MKLWQMQLLGLVVIAGGAYYLVKRGTEVLNPADPDNAINRAADQLTRDITGDEKAYASDYTVLGLVQNWMFKSSWESVTPIERR